MDAIFRYNSKASYSTYGKHKEIGITGKVLTQFPIVVADDSKSFKAFKLKLRDDVFELNVYKYFKHWDEYRAPGGYEII